MEFNYRESNSGPSSAQGGLQSSSHVKSGKGMSLENNEGYWKESYQKVIHHFPFTEFQLHSLTLHRIDGPNWQSHHP